MSNNTTKMIAFAIQLENTRIIFDFMELLDRYCRKQRHQNNCEASSYENTYLYFGQGGLRRRQSIINDLYQEVNKRIDNAYLQDDANQERKDSSKDVLLWQNPLSQYINFFMKWLHNDKNSVTVLRENAFKAITWMLHYYQTVKYLAETKDEYIDFDSLPYLYEDICITLADMTGSEMCYILYDNSIDNNIQLIARSGYLVSSKDLENNEGNGKEESDASLSRKLEDTQGEPLFENIVVDVKQDKYKNESISNYSSFGIYTLDKYLLIELPFSVGALSKEDQSKKFFILLQKKNVIGEERSVANDTVKVLFLRDRLMEILNRDFSRLLNARFECGYIKSIDNGFDTKKGMPSILHFSDSHITGTAAWDVNSTRYQSLNKAIKKISDNKIDLIAITGDIIQGSGSAATAQQSYRTAAEFYKNVAITLWGFKYNNAIRLSHDWKRRIMITTGNHDYLTMNELVSSSKARKTRFGEPDLNHNTDTLVKFTYYLGFLMEFLDAPIDILIKNDLNEHRYYKNLNLKVLILNTVSQANVLQNNKVGFKKEKVEALLPAFHENPEDKSLHRVCLLHHGPKHEIDYVNDVYASWKYKAKEHLEIVNTYECYKKVIKSYNKSNYRNVSEEKFISSYTQLSSRLEREQRSGTDYGKEFILSPLYADMTELNNYIRKRNESISAENKIGFKDEFIIELKSKHHRMWEMMRYDNRMFKNIINSITQNTPNIIFLSGHVHKNNGVEDQMITFPELAFNFIEGKLEESFSLYKFIDDIRVERLIMSRKNTQKDYQKLL